MKQVNKITLSIQSNKTNISIAEKSVMAFLQSYLSERDAADMICAVSEAINNCFDHAYENEAGIITLTMQAYDTNRVRITIGDKGRGIPDINRARAPLYSSLPNEHHCGMGITVMESFSDEITIKSAVGRGTVVTLTKG